MPHKKSSKRSDDTTVKVDTGQQPKLLEKKETSEAEVVDELMTIVDTAFETCDLEDHSIIKSVKAGDMFGCESNEMEVTLKDGSVFSVEVMRVRGPKS